MLGSDKWLHSACWHQVKWRIRRAIFIRLGLPCHPMLKRMLWYNGDYVFYSLALNTDFDFFIVCEFDLAMNAIDLRNAVDRMIADGMDAVGSGMGKRSRGWGWHAPQTNWLRAEIAHAQSSEEFQQVHGVFFPFVMMSRQAALHLYSRRLEMRGCGVRAKWPRNGRSARPSPRPNCSAAVFTSPI